MSFSIMFVSGALEVVFSGSDEGYDETRLQAEIRAAEDAADTDADTGPDTATGAGSDISEMRCALQALGRANAADWSLVAAHNDAFRRQGGGGQGRWRFSREVEAEGAAFVSACLAGVAGMECTAQNDPTGRREAGEVMVRGKPVFWMIELCNEDYSSWTPDPECPVSTWRDLTVMFLREW